MPPCRSTLHKPSLDGQPDPARWARQAATLHAVQALTTEVDVEVVPAAAGRGVRWLRDVLRKDGPHPGIVASKSDPLIRMQSGVARHGVVFGDGGHWHSCAAVPLPSCRSAPSLRSLRQGFSLELCLTGQQSPCSQSSPSRLASLGTRWPSRCDFDSDSDDEGVFSEINDPE